MNLNDNSNQKETLINKIKKFFQKIKKNKSKEILNNEIEDILNRLNQNSDINQKKETPKHNGNFINRIKYLLRKKETRKIVIAIGTLTIAVIVLIISIILISNSNTTNALRKNTWEDFIINIDGNNIKLGEKISKVESIGFTTTDENYKVELDQTFTSGGIAFTYKNDEESPVIYFSAYNSESKKKTAADCELNGIEIHQEFYKKYEVTLPGGIQLTETLTINDIIDEWGKATNEAENSYSWIKEGSEVRIYTSSDKTIFSIVYDA